MYSFYYEIRGFRAHDGAEPPESWLTSSSFVFARHFSPEATVRPGPHPVCFRTVSCSAEESGMSVDSTNLGAGGTAGPGNRDQGGSGTFKWASSKPQEYRHLPA